MVGTPCDSDWYDLPPEAPRPPAEDQNMDKYFPFADEVEFQFANFLYTRDQMSAGNINILIQLMDAWQNSGSQPLLEQPEPIDPPFNSKRHMQSVIDTILLGDVPWRGFKVTYDGEVPEHNAPSWMKNTYEVWFRNLLEVMEGQIGNPDFKGEIDYAPKQVLGKDGKRQFTDMMSGDWSWEQAVHLLLYIY